MNENDDCELSDRDQRDYAAGKVLAFLERNTSLAAVLCDPDREAIRLLAEHAQRESSIDRFVEAIETARAAGKLTKPFVSIGYVLEVAERIEAISLDTPINLVRSRADAGAAVIQILAAELVAADRRLARTASSPSPEQAVERDKEEEAAYQIGKEEGFSEAIQRIDQLTGGDGEYRWSSLPERNCPDEKTMIAGIVERFTAKTSPALNMSLTAVAELVSSARALADDSTDDCSAKRIVTVDPDTFDRFCKSLVAVDELLPEHDDVVAALSRQLPSDMARALEAWRDADQATADAVEHIERAIAEGWYDDPSVSGHVDDSNRRADKAWERARQLRDAALASSAGSGGAVDAAISEAVQAGVLAGMRNVAREVLDASVAVYGGPAGGSMADEVQGQLETVLYGTRAGKVILDDVDPLPPAKTFDEWIGRYCGRMNPDDMRFGSDEMRTAFLAGRLSEAAQKGGRTVEVDNRTPDRQLAEAIVPFVDFMRGAERVPDDLNLTHGSTLAKRQLTAGDFRRLLKAVDRRVR